VGGDGLRAIDLAYDERLLALIPSKLGSMRPSVNSPRDTPMFEVKLFFKLFHTLVNERAGCTSPLDYGLTISGSRRKPLMGLQPSGKSAYKQ